MSLADLAVAACSHPLHLQPVRPCEQGVPGLTDPKLQPLFHRDQLELVMERTGRGGFVIVVTTPRLMLFCSEA